jgi:hypothetical protein
LIITILKKQAGGEQPARNGKKERAAQEPPRQDRFPVNSPGVSGVPPLGLRIRQ